MRTETRPMRPSIRAGRGEHPQGLRRMIELGVLTLLLKADCRQCGHVFGWHWPRSLMTGMMACRKRTGWQRRTCPCQDYRETG